jgi:hypothetical protein
MTPRTLARVAVAVYSLSRLIVPPMVQTRALVGKYARALMLYVAFLALAA